MNFLSSVPQNDSYSSFSDTDSVSPNSTPRDHTLVSAPESTPQREEFVVRTATTTSVLNSARTELEKLNQGSENDGLPSVIHHQNVKDVLVPADTDVLHAANDTENTIEVKNYNDVDDHNEVQDYTESRVHPEVNSDSDIKAKSKDNSNSKEVIRKKEFSSVGQKSLIRQGHLEVDDVSIVGEEIDGFEKNKNLLSHSKELPNSLMSSNDTITNRPDSDTIEVISAISKFTIL